MNLLEILSTLHLLCCCNVSSLSSLLFCKWREIAHIHFQIKLWAWPVRLGRLPLLACTPRDLLTVLFAIFGAVTKMGAMYILFQPSTSLSGIFCLKTYYLQNCNKICWNWISQIATSPNPCSMFHWEWQICTRISNCSYPICVPSWGFESSLYIALYQRCFRKYFVFICRHFSSNTKWNFENQILLGNLISINYNGQYWWPLPAYVHNSIVHLQQELTWST